MKTRAIVLSCLMGAVVLCIGYEHSRAESDAGKPSLKIGVISVQKIFRDCERRKKHDMELKDEEDKINMELNKLQKEIVAAEAGLGTLRPQSSEYLELDRDVTLKRNTYQLRREFHGKLLGLKDKEWTKEFYEAILQVTGEVSKEKNLDLVFERSEPDFSIVSATELLVTIQTHKLLYSAGCVDITAEVKARLDKE
jgi:Skp family chaperone for outer membrane proteins